MGIPIRSPRIYIFLKGILWITLSCVVILACLEGLLRGVGYGNTTKLFVENPSRQTCCIINKQFYAQFFPPDHRDWILDSLNWGWEISKEKPPDTVRIMVVGSSVALGHQLYAFCWGRILKIMLQDAYPSLNFELYNLAAGAVNSNVMRCVVPQAIPYHPDFMIVYMGNNEYFGPYGPASEPDGMPPRTAAIRLNLYLQQFRTIQLMNRAASVTRYPLTGGAGGFFEKTFKLAPDHPGRARMYDTYRENLTAMCRDASNAGVVTILSTLGNNLRDWSPYSSAHRSGMSQDELDRWNNYYQAGLSLLKIAEEGDAPLFNNALTCFLQAAEIDPVYADLQYRMGLCHESLGDYDQARTAFYRARDCDAHAVRADGKINAIIRECAATLPDTVLADMDACFQAASEHGVMGEDLFYDMMHVNYRGEYVLAAGMCETLRKEIDKRFHLQASAGTKSYEECMAILGNSPYLEMTFLQGAMQNAEALRKFKKDIVTRGLEERMAALSPQLHQGSPEEALNVLRGTDLYKKGDVAISRLIVELLLVTEEKVREKTLAAQLPPEVLDVFANSLRPDEAASEVERLRSKFPTRPDVRMLVDMVAQNRISK